MTGERKTHSLVIFCYYEEVIVWVCLFEKRAYGTNRTLRSERNCIRKTTCLSFYL
mgnify:CR=1 FL=1